MMVLLAIFNYSILIAAMIMGYQVFEDKYGESYATWLVVAPFIAGILGFRIISALFSIFLYYGVFLFFKDVNSFPLLSTILLYMANFIPILFIFSND